MPPKDTEIVEINKKLDEQGGLLKEIHLNLAGNELYGQKGLKHRMEDLERKVENWEVKDQKREKEENKRLFKAGAIGGGVGSIITVIAPKTILAKMWTALIGIFL